jgi:hypothetical protein
MARRCVTALAPVINVAAAGESEASAPSIRYSRTVVDIDVADGRLVLDEVGPSSEGGPGSSLTLETE